jgi:hypothetical protein
MQGLEGTSLHVLPASKNNHSTSNLGLPGQFGKHEPQAQPVRFAPASPPFGQAAASTDLPAQVPYQAFLTLVSFVASIVFSLGISAAQSFATSQTFFGSDISNQATISNALSKASRICAWAGALAGVGLMASLALQLLLTSPMMMKGMLYHKGLMVMVASMAWLSVIVVCGSIVCVAEAVKVIDQTAGLTIQVRDIIYSSLRASNTGLLVVVAAGCWVWPTCGLGMGKLIMSTGVTVWESLYKLGKHPLALVFRFYYLVAWSDALRRNTGHDGCGICRFSHGHSEAIFQRIPTRGRCLREANSAARCGSCV